MDRVGCGINCREPVIKAQGLVKMYGSSPVRVVDEVSFEVSKGECFGFLGPNGAGKTTTLRMICCLSPVTKGTLSVFGMDVASHSRDIKKRIGVVPQEDNLDPDLTVFENLSIYSSYFSLPKEMVMRKAAELLDFLQLTEKKNEKIEKLSGGMKKRLLIARSLINDPDLIILDEPTTGLDPQARHLIWQNLRFLKESGATMVLTTHYMEEASRLCDRLVIMDCGKVLVEGRPQELVSKIIGKEVVELRLSHSDNGEGMLEKIRGMDFAQERAGDTLFLFSDSGGEIAKRLLGTAEGTVVHRHATLEDVFLKLTGRELRD